MERLTKEEEGILNRKHIAQLLRDPRITDWEREFLESIGIQIGSKELTEKQIRTLNKILEKYEKPKRVR